MPGTKAADVLITSVDPIAGGRLSPAGVLRGLLADEPIEARKPRVQGPTGVGILICLDAAPADNKDLRLIQGVMLTRSDLRLAIMEGAVERIRPKMMTVVAIMAWRPPILWSKGAGSEVMGPIAVRMMGRMASSTVLTLLVIPAIYAIVRSWGLPPNRPLTVEEKSQPHRTACFEIYLVNCIAA